MLQNASLNDPEILRLREAAIRRYFSKKVFLKISLYIQENTCVEISFGLLHSQFYSFLGGFLIYICSALSFYCVLILPLNFINTSTNVKRVLFEAIHMECTP